MIKGLDLWTRVEQWKSKSKAFNTSAKFLNLSLDITVWMGELTDTKLEEWLISEGFD